MLFDVLRFIAVPEKILCFYFYDLDLDKDFSAACANFYYRLHIALEYYPCTVSLTSSPLYFQVHHLIFLISYP